MVLGHVWRLSDFTRDRSYGSNVRFFQLCYTWRLLGQLCIRLPFSVQGLPPLLYGQKI